jgi:hypothetical protein
VVAGLASGFVKEVGVSKIALVEGAQNCSTSLGQRSGAVEVFRSVPDRRGSEVVAVVVAVVEAVVEAYVASSEAVEASLLGSWRSLAYRLPSYNWE